MRFDYFKETIRDAAILTTSYVAGNILSEVHDRNQLIILVDLTMGDLTSAELKVEFSDDGTNYYQETASSVSGGTISESLGERVFTESGSYRVLVPINDRYVKVSAKGTGDITDSSMALKAIVGRV